MTSWGNYWGTIEKSRGINPGFNYLSLTVHSTPVGVLD